MFALCLSYPKYGGRARSDVIVRPIKPCKSYKHGGLWKIRTQKMKIKALSILELSHTADLSRLIIRIQSLPGDGTRRLPQVVTKPFLFPSPNSFLR